MLECMEWLVRAEFCVTLKVFLHFAIHRAATLCIINEIALHHTT